MEWLNLETICITGVKINYLYVCERKLWLFDRNIALEKESDKVLLGKVLADYAYPREKKKEILIDNLINIDIVGEDEIREVKYSNRLKTADRIQLLYYLYYLKRLGVKKRGILNYPKQRKREEVILTKEAEKEVIAALKRVKEIISLPNPPPPQKLPYCKKCAYYEFCWG
jgi:CRISPR-associated exonuclease Cas4